MDKHRQDLMPALLDLYGLGVFPLQHEDLATWYSKPEIPCWPITKGQVYREADGSLTVRLDVERKREWLYLKQHLPEDPVWAGIEGWKQAMARDLAMRLSLLGVIIHLIENRWKRGGLDSQCWRRWGTWAVPNPR
jgi:hypothetical protein